MILNAEDLPSLENYLKVQGWISPNESVISATKAGDGNMNYTLRIRTERRTMIVKQARPYVEKYPSIAAPVERAVIEAQFYQHIQGSTVLQSYMPNLLGTDEPNSVLVLEDLGVAADYTFLYQPNQTLSKVEIGDLARYASVLHQIAPPANELFANRAMRTLNHEHIFVYPLMENNGFDLDLVQVGLQAIARPYQQDASLKAKARALGAVYLADDSHLLHGDFYPGSFLKTSEGIRIIDPEFCFVGAAEFDMAVLVAHLKMARQPLQTIEYLLAEYQAPASFNSTLMYEFVGIEIIRRLIGLAQLPLTLSLAEKHTLLAEARAYL